MPNLAEREAFRQLLDVYGSPVGNDVKSNVLAVFSEGPVSSDQRATKDGLDRARHLSLLQLENVDNRQPDQRDQEDQGRDVHAHPMPEIIKT